MGGPLPRRQPRPYVPRPVDHPEATVTVRAVTTKRRTRTLWSRQRLRAASRPGSQQERVPGRLAKMLACRSRTCSKSCAVSGTRVAHDPQRPHRAGYHHRVVAMIFDDHENEARGFDPWASSFPEEQFDCDPAVGYGQSFDIIEVPYLRRKTPMSEVTIKTREDGPLLISGPVTLTIILATSTRSRPQHRPLPLRAYQQTSVL